MPIELTEKWIYDAINTRHANYNETVELARQIETHAYGLISPKLIDERRPNEPEAIKEYRKKIYVPITKEAISKVLTSLQKIRRSQDWKPTYPEEVPSIIRQGESLEDYCEKNYPTYLSLTNWAFSELLQRYLYDPNGFVAVIPQIPDNLSEYLKPIAQVFASSQVINYKEGEYVVLQSADSVISTTNGLAQSYQGNIYYIITPARICRYDQQEKGLTLTLDYEHNLGVLPAFKIGGVFLKRSNNDTIYESRIASMIPSLDEAAREYSDLQAEVVQHIHSEKYIYTNIECPDCKGVAPRPNQKNKCSKCGGVGHLKTVSPYGEYLIKANNVGETGGIPTPPVGYVQKKTDIAKLQDDRVKSHIYTALASINMEFLAQTPLNQSGLAKEVDKDELNNFVNSVAEDIVAVLDKVYFFFNEFRYRTIIPGLENRRKMLPVIPVPERFDILNSTYLMDDLKKAREAGVNPNLLKQMEAEYADKKYNANPEIADELKTIYDLDPLYGYTMTDKVTMLNNGGILDEDYILSCNIYQFVRRAQNEYEDFLTMDFQKKKDIVLGYAKEITADLSIKNSISESFNSLDNE